MRAGSVSGLRRLFKRCDHFDQIGQRTRLHFFRDLCAVKFNSCLAEAEVSSYNFVGPIIASPKETIISWTGEGKTLKQIGNVILCIQLMKPQARVKMLKHILVKTIAWQMPNLAAEWDI